MSRGFESHALRLRCTGWIPGIHWDPPRLSFRAPGGFDNKLTTNEFER